jgi:small subunit ribosomal protein S3
MGQKVHPLGFRMGITQDHLSQWFPERSAYPKLVREDHWIRNYIESHFVEAGITKILVVREASLVDVTIHASRPVLLVGRKGKKLQELRESLQAKLADGTWILLQVKAVRKPNTEAKLLAQLICQELEQRTPFRRALKKALRLAKGARVEGIKIQIAGRLNGAEIARREWVREGRVPLQTLRAHIDYCHQEARTIYGILGIQIWIFKGEHDAKS